MHILLSTKLKETSLGSLHVPSTWETHQFLDFKVCSCLPVPFVVSTFHLDLEGGCSCHSCPLRGKGQGLYLLIVLVMMDGLPTNHQAPHLDHTLSQNRGRTEMPCLCCLAQNQFEAEPVLSKWLSQSSMSVHQNSESSNESDWLWTCEKGLFRQQQSSTSRICCHKKQHHICWHPCSRSWKWGPGFGFCHATKEGLVGARPQKSSFRQISFI